MTDLLSPVREPAATAAPGRTLSLLAVAAGLLCSLGTLLGCLGAGLAGWFAADAGRYGDTRDALRVGADAWLMGHGAAVQVGDVAVTVAPLGLTLLIGLIGYRLGSWAAERTGEVDLAGVAGAALLMGATHAVVAVVTGVFASLPAASVALGQAAVGGLLLGILAGGAGLLRGSGQGARLLAAAPPAVRGTLVGAAAAALAVVAASAALVALALMLDFGDAATVLSRLRVDGPAGLSYTVVAVAFVPNAVLLGVAYLLGPGFVLGTGTLVSPSVVVLGPVPAFPLLAALPDQGGTASWTPWLVVLPATVAALTIGTAVRRAGVLRFQVGAACGLVAGALAALVLTALAVSAGGSAGPGRMAELGVASWADLLLASGVSLGGSGLIGGLAGTWRARARTATTTVTVAVSETVAERPEMSAPTPRPEPSPHPAPTPRPQPEHRPSPAPRPEPRPGHTDGAPGSDPGSDPSNAPASDTDAEGEPEDR